jgi:hypothetical protein
MKAGVFRSGDRVTVRSRDEILSTLDADGTLHGLPFMPEMLDWCGRPVRVERRAEKTCVDVALPVYPNRRFPANDVVFLDGPRCDGRFHDGCTRACKVFWKEDWLLPSDAVETSTRAAETGFDAALPPLKTKSDESHYFCQSTQLLAATEAFPGNQKLWRIRIFAREIRNGDRSVPEILKLLMLWSWQRLLRLLHGEPWLRGPNKQTPAVSLDLKPGDRVRIKSRAEVEATLNPGGSNRGLKVCYEMTRYCGRQAEVRHRVDRIIDERTGTMRELRDTVALQNVSGKVPKVGDSECLCADETGDCARSDLMYWREIWLERAEDGGS